MKIVHVIEPLAGGMVTFLTSLVENLPLDTHIIVHGQREHVTPLTEVKKQFRFPNVKFIRWISARRSPGLKKDIPAFVELYKILKRLKENKHLDVVHLHCSKGGFIGRLVCRLLNLQHLVIYTPNGAPFMAGTNYFSNYLYKRLEQIASLFGGQVVCCSPSEQEAYKKAGIHAVTINNGIPYQKIIQRKRKRTRDAIFRVVTSGRIVDQKNPGMFNKIAAYFEDFPGIKFIWAGDGNFRHLLTAKNITITGWQTPEKAAEMVANGDVYLSTAKYEGLPFAVLEALAMNKPVLLTDCTGNKDLTNHLNGAAFSDEQEAVYKLLQFYNNESMLKLMDSIQGYTVRYILTWRILFCDIKNYISRRAWRLDCLIPLKQFIMTDHELIIFNTDRELKECMDQIKLYLETHIHDLTIEAGKKDDKIKYLQEELAKAKNNMEGNTQLINKLLGELSKLHNDIDWYKRTYEKRSFLGTIREKIFRKH